MPDQKRNECDDAYLALTDEEWRAWRENNPNDMPCPKTPERRVVDEQRSLAYMREGMEGAGEMDDPRFDRPEWDNWRLWLVYQDSKRLLGAGGLAFHAVSLPAFVGPDGKPDIAACADSWGRTHRTVRRWLDRLVELGVNFGRIHDWPHPLTGAAPSQKKQAVH